MSEETQTEDEPSIEEILDSIRQIISEDDEDEGSDENQEVEDNPEAGEDPVVETEPEIDSGAELEASEELDQSAIDDMDFDAPAPDSADEEPEDENIEDVLELTELVNSEDNQIEVDLKESEEDDIPEIEDLPEVNESIDEEVPSKVDEVAPDPEPISVPVEKDSNSLLTDSAETAAVTAITELVRKTAVEQNGITLEDIVRTELKPLLRDWLDKHLPTVIERLVQEELERVSKRVLDD